MGEAKVLRKLKEVSTTVGSPVPNLSGIDQTAKHDGNDSSSKHCSKSNDIGKLSGKGSDSGKHNSSTLSDKQWNDITKLSGGSKPDENIESLDIMKVEDLPDDELTSGLDDIVKFNGTPLMSTDLSSKSDSHLQSTYNGNKSSKHGTNASGK